MSIPSYGHSVVFERGGGGGIGARGISPLSPAPPTLYDTLYMLMALLDMYVWFMLIQVLANIIRV